MKQYSCRFTLPLKHQHSANVSFSTVTMKQEALRMGFLLFWNSLASSCGRLSSRHDEASGVSSQELLLLAQDSVKLTSVTVISHYRNCAQVQRRICCFTGTFPFSTHFIDHNLPNYRHTTYKPETLNHKHFWVSRCVKQRGRSAKSSK